MAEDSELQVSCQPRVYAEWRIKKFFDLPIEEDYECRSPGFSLCGEKWCLVVYTNGESTYRSSGWVGLFLVKENFTAQRFEYRFGIQKADGSELNAIGSEDTFEMKKTWGTFKFIRREELLLTSQDVLGPDDTLTIFCSVRTMGKPLICSTAEASTQTPLNGIPNLIENFKDMYLSKRCADVRITVKGREFLAHRNVLTSRSTVFSSMFSSDMVEKNSGKIEIIDCDSSTFEEFLLFLYSGMLDMVTPSNAASLYQTADKYDVHELKNECVHCMINNLTVDSLCDVIRLATLHEEADLLQAATEFFIGNAKDILVTLKWQDFSAEYPSLGNELFLKFVHKHAGER